MSEILALVLYIEKARFHALICVSSFKQSETESELKRREQLPICLNITVPHQPKARAKRKPLGTLSRSRYGHRCVSVSSEFQRVLAVPSFSSDDFFSVREPPPM